MAYNTGNVTDAYRKLTSQVLGNDYFELEEATLVQCLQKVGLASLNEKRLLDVGCGEGRFCRKFRDCGAAMTGCDLSEAMIQAAQAREDAESAPPATRPPAAPPIRYSVADITAPSAALPDGPFDGAISMLVLHLCDSEASLQRAVEFIARHVRPGGGVVVIVVGGSYIPTEQQVELQRKLWGFTSEFARDGSDGKPRQVRFVMGDSGYSVINYQHDDPVYMRCLRQAGVKQVEKVELVVPQHLQVLLAQHEANEGMIREEEDVERCTLLRQYISNPHIAAFVGIKAA